MERKVVDNPIKDKLLDLINEMESSKDIFSRQWQLKYWKELSRFFSLIRLVDNKPVEKDWKRWCQQRRKFSKIPFKDGENAGIACGKASGIIVLTSYNHFRFMDWLDLNGKVELPDTLHVGWNCGVSHYYFRYPEVEWMPRCQKIMDWEDPRKVLFEIKGDGCFVSAMGSYSGGKGNYSIIQQDQVREEPLILDAPNWLIDIAQYGFEFESADDFARAYYEAYEKPAGFFGFEREYFFSTLEKQGKNEEIVNEKISNFIIEPQYILENKSNPAAPVNEFFLKVIPSSSTGNPLTISAKARELTSPTNLSTMFLERATANWKSHKAASEALAAIINDSSVPRVREVAAIGYDKASGW